MKSLSIILLIISLISCAPRRPAKVDEITTKPYRSHTKSYSRRSTTKKTTIHRVIQGESLYSIGFKYQMDYKTLAAINNISPPYRIYPNQVIKLKANPIKTTTQPQVLTTPIKVSKPVVAKTETIKTTSKPQQKTTQKTVTTKPATKNNVVVKPIKNTPTKPIINTPNKTNLNWLWPTKGKIRTTFLASNPARKGISIGGNSGQDVKAAESGVVVYSGDGLLGYGELIIIKHNDTYLSAYGHNKSRKVKEGDIVKRGQAIALLGSSGTNVNNLHFEIRKNGAPVNPLNYVKP